MGNIAMSKVTMVLPRPSKLSFRLFFAGLLLMTFPIINQYVMLGRIEMNDQQVEDLQVHKKGKGIGKGIGAWEQEQSWELEKEQERERERKRWEQRENMWKTEQDEWNRRRIIMMKKNDELDEGIIKDNSGHNVDHGRGNDEDENSH